MADQNSDFCVTSPSNWKMFQSPTGQRIVVPQHSQWIVLNKIHAQTMTSRWQGMHAANGWTVPVWTGGGINHTFPNLPKSVLLSKDFGTCTDEWVFFSGVYGVLRTDGYSPSSIQLPSFGPILSAVGGAAQGVCRTFAFWGIGVGADDYPPGGNDLAADLWTLGSRISCYPSKCSGYSPLEMQAIWTRGLQALRRSRFLFARKLLHGSISKDKYIPTVLSQ